MILSEMLSLASEIEFESYKFNIFCRDDHIYLQASYLEADIVTNKFELQRTRKWLISPHMTKSEFVQTVFKCALTSMEHRTREAFKYKGKRIFGPHFDVDGLWDMCKDEKFDCRVNKEAL